MDQGDFQAGVAFVVYKTAILKAGYRKEWSVVSAETIGLLGDAQEVLVQFVVVVEVVVECDGISAVGDVRQEHFRLLSRLEGQALVGLIFRKITAGPVKTNKDLVPVSLADIFDHDGQLFILVAV